jgi:hypothetical protein
MNDDGKQSMHASRSKSLLRDVKSVEGQVMHRLVSIWIEHIGKRNGLPPALAREEGSELRRQGETVRL